MRILIVEDEKALAGGLKFNFEQEGYDVALAGDGPTALKLFDAESDDPFDIVILDLMLPGMSGYETCEEIRKINSDIPILVLSARTLSEDKAQAFDCGTDQYMTKPFALPELLSRVRNLLDRRRATSTNGTKRTSDPLDTFSFGTVVVDFEKFEIRAGEKIHNPTTMELDLMRFFIENDGKVLSRVEILENVWGLDSDVSTRTIDNFVLRLRKIIEANPSEPRHILSVRGTGYRFIAHPDES